jgi:hypothetical protein
MGTGLRLYEEEGITGVEFPVGRRFIDMLAVDKVRRRNGSSAGLVFSATLCASHTDARSGSPDPDQAWEAPRSGFRFIFVIESGGSARRIASNGRSRPRLLAGKDLSDNHQLAFSPADNSSTLLRRQTMWTLRGGVLEAHNVFKHPNTIPHYRNSGHRWINLDGNGVAHRSHPPVFQGSAQPHRTLMQAQVARIWTNYVTRTDKAYRVAGSIATCCSYQRMKSPTVRSWSTSSSGMW